MTSFLKCGDFVATDKRPTMLRLPEPLYEKIRYLAYLEHRSLNMEIEHALQTYITGFESVHGPISVPQAPSQEPES